MRLRILWMLLLVSLVGCGKPQQLQEANPAPTQTLSVAEAPAATGTAQAIATSTLAPPPKESPTPIASPTFRVIGDPMPPPSPPGTIPPPMGEFAVDFTACEPTTDAVYFSFGHLVYTITGIEGSHCLMDYGAEVENPRWDGALNIHCRIPVELGSQTFTVYQMGPDFASIEQFCRGPVYALDINFAACSDDNTPGTVMEFITGRVAFKVVGYDHEHCIFYYDQEFTTEDWDSTFSMACVVPVDVERVNFPADPTKGVDFSAIGKYCIER